MPKPRWVIIDDDKKTFTNPYNFIALDPKCQRENDYEKTKERDDLLTGYIEVEIETKTPVFIPNTTNDNAFHEKTDDGKPIKTYDFFSYEDISEQDRHDRYSLPVIPGSELRGVIRSAFETVTASCLSTLESDRRLYKRTVKVGKPGKLVYEGGDWKILPCERATIKKHKYESDVKDRYPEGKLVYVDVSSRGQRGPLRVHDISPTQKHGYQPAYIHHGEPFETKKHESVFLIIPRRDPIPVRQEAVERFIENVKLYQDPKVNIHHKDNDGEHSGYQKLGKISTERLKKTGALVYYTEYNGIYYLAPAAISREVFKKRLKKVVKDFFPCDNKADLCAACTLFGMVSDKGSVASRVRFADAFPTKTKALQEYFELPFIFKELASPKPSATEFYLQRPDAADMWNYDYAIKDKRSLQPYHPEIRGRKFYWHHKTVNKYISIEKSPSDRNVGGRPVKAGETFRSKIFFNEITEDELKKLLWVLRPQGNTRNHCHKIGMGKPIGFGSIKIQVKDVYIRTIALGKESIEYHVAQWEYFEPAKREQIYTEARQLLECSATIYNEFLKMTDFEQAPDNLAYPEAIKLIEKENREEPGIHYWFVANKVVHPDARGTNPIISQTLPEITSLNVSLKKYKETKGQQESRRRNGHYRKFKRRH